MHKIEMFLVVDADGDCGFGADQDSAIENYNDNIGGSGPQRIIKLNVAVRLPVVIEADVTIPDEAGELVTVEA